MRKKKNNNNGKLNIKSQTNENNLKTLEIKR